MKNIYKSEWLPPLTNLELNYIFINKIQRFISLIPICKDKGFESEFHRIMELIKLKSIEINPSNSSWEEIAAWKMPHLQMEFIKEKLEREGLVEMS
ncbi:hypothetical protein [Butyricimonas virosa]|uniref:hypothetical protein n=1 Tax=Butyricimonas virosa TaxID=544645 RepID=UPI000E42F774|nr:hypothetical protein [Butyricimonas virosa]RGL83409.1 hypothetical protein DXC42_15675 [Butyricimonas virosa]